MSDQETAWLIERYDSQDRPMWWCGCVVTISGNLWSYESLEAIRFAREIDATNVARSLPSPSGFAREHAWVGPTDRSDR